MLLDIPTRRQITRIGRTFPLPEIAPSRRFRKDPSMDFDPTAPILALVIEPGDEVANLRPVSVNQSGEIGILIGGHIEAVEIDGGSVLWLDESGKNKGLATNLLATKIAHRLHAGLYPDDTVNGRALVVGEAAGPHGDLVSVDVTPATLAALADIDVVVRSG
jgi:hypothetical protein